MGATRLGKCGTKLCCGHALEEKSASTAPLLENYVCNEENSTEWIDIKDDSVFYGFKCLPEAAQRIAISTMALLAATYIMA